MPKTNGGFPVALAAAGAAAAPGAAFAFGGVVVLLTAEHFADAIVDSGGQNGIERFVLVQWVAPVASESPELLVACLYAWRLNGTDAIGTLLSSKVNQWTLLVGTIPVVFAVASTGIAACRSTGTSGWSCC